MRPILLPKLTKDTAHQIEQWIVENMPPYARGAVLGMSGGVDSSLVAVLTRHAFRGDWRTGAQRRIAEDTYPLTLWGYALPTKLNSPDDIKDAQQVAEQFHIPFGVIDLGPVVEGMDLIFDKTSVPASLDVGEAATGLTGYDRGNMISRIRANVLWTLAAKQQAIVMGTGNKDEDYGVGYYTLLGDGAVYMNPIACLTKRLVRELAAESGLPEDLVKRTPTAGLEPGQTDAKDLGYPYEFVELVTQAIEQGFSLWDITRHPQITKFGYVLAGLGKWVGDSGPRYDRAVLDVLHRHDLAKRKAAYICPKVPNIELPLELAEREAA